MGKLSLRRIPTRFTCLIVAAAAVALLLASRPAFAGEEPEHYHLVYVLARTVGFDDKDARILASASWSVDLNPDTIAFDPARGDFRKVASYAAKLSHSDDDTVRQLYSDQGLLAHAPKGMMYHALGRESDRRTIDAEWQRLLTGPAARERVGRLVLTGMYLHFVVDRYVHPPDAILGHLLLIHQPDRAIANPVKFQAAAEDVFSILKKTALEVGGEGGRRIDVDARLRALELDDLEQRRRYHSQIVSALSKAYGIVPDQYAEAGRELQKAFAKKLIIERTPTAADSAAQFLRNELGKTFSRVNETLGVFPIEGPGDPKKYAFTYSADPHGSLMISGPGGIKLRIDNPVASLTAAQGTNPLAAAKRNLIDQARIYSSKAVLLATTADVAKLGVRVGVARGQEVVLAKAAEALDRAREQAGTLYQRGTDGSIRVYQRTADGTVRVWQHTTDAIQLLEKKAGQGIVAFETPLREAAKAVESASGIGGVRLAYSGDVLQSLLDRSDTAAETSLVRVDGPIRLVSLKSLLGAIRTAGGHLERMEPAARTLGGLTRIYGYLIEPAAKDVILIGSAAAGGQSIRADDLVNGLKLVYRDGIVPMISLDPDPTDLSGPQQVRLIGVPRETHFARVMVEADYAMKKIAFGASPVSGGSFRSASQLTLDHMERGSADDRVYSRYWLTPAQPGPSDVQVGPQNLDALFLGRVQVLTEALELTSGGLTGTGSTEPISEETARRFTDNYQTIAAQYPVFRALEGLNDIVLLGSILRKAGAGEKVLRDLADADIRTTEAPLPTSFPAITHVERRNTHAVGLVGGVNLRTVTLRSKWARYQDRQLARLRASAVRLAASGQLTLDAGLDSLVISPPRGTRGEAERFLDLGAQKLQARRYEEADRSFSQAIEADATLTEAYVGRAMANAGLGNQRRALRDARKALELDPDDEDVAAMTLAIGLESGQDLSVLFNRSDATATARARAAGLFIKRGLARITVRKTVEAEQDLTLAIALEPANAEAYLLRGAMKVELAVVATGTPLFDEYKKPAYDDLNRAIELNPQLSSAYAARSKLRAFDYSHAGAIDDASKAISLAPSDAVGYSHRGIAQAFLRKANESLSDLSKAIELAPYDGRMYFNRGLVRAMTGDKNGAMEDFADAIMRSPSLLGDVKREMERHGLVDRPIRR